MHRQTWLQNAIENVMIYGAAIVLQLATLAAAAGIIYSITHR